VEGLEDLYGCWVNEGGYLPSSRGPSHRYSFCFDKSGNAVSRAWSRHGGRTSECTLDAKARMKGKGFTVAEGRPCPGWIAGFYSCTLTAPGVARCVLTLTDGTEKAIDFTYSGEGE
jgi:hypothetical protein